MFESKAAAAAAEAASTCLLCSDNVFLNILAGLLWLILIALTFVALAIVADDYLAPSLEVLAELCAIPHNVAAASFLAFGSAVPEIMTSVMSTIRGKVDVSLPAILGSGCIAYAIIPPCCVFCIQPWAMSAKQQRRAMRKISKNTTMTIDERDAAIDALSEERPLGLSFKPLLRDVGVYVISLGLTVFFISDNIMNIFESGILILLYVAYLSSLYIWRAQWNDTEEDAEDSAARAPLISQASKSYEKPTTADDDSKGSSSAAGASGGDVESGEVIEPIVKVETSVPAPNVAQEPTVHGAADDGAVAAAAAAASQEPEGTQQAEDPTPEGEGAETAPAAAGGEGAASSSEAGTGAGAGSGITSEDVEARLAAVAGALEDTRERDDSDARYRSYSLSSVDSEGRSRSGSVDDPPPRWMVILDVAYWPFERLFEWTIPNPDEEKNQSGCMCTLTFVIALIYVSVLSMVTLKCVSQFGKTIGMENSLAGVTLVALGAEIPDTFASMAVAKQGEGPSSVSNCLNSQIINLLIGLGFPYFLRSAITETDMQLGSPSGTQPFIGALLSMIVVLFCISTFGDMKWFKRAKPQLSTGWSYLLCVVYVLVVIAIAVWTVLT